MAQRRSRRGRIDKEHERILQRRISLLKDLNPDDITDRLLETEVINFDDSYDIAAEKTLKKKRDVLVEKLLFSGDKSFYKFILVLSDTGYNHIAKELERELPETSLREYNEVKRESMIVATIDTSRQVERTDTDKMHEGKNVTDQHLNIQPLCIADGAFSDSNTYSTSDQGSVYQNNSEEHVYTKLQNIKHPHDTCTLSQPESGDYQNSNKNVNDSAWHDYQNEVESWREKEQTLMLPKPCQIGTYDNIPYLNVNEQKGTSDLDASKLQKPSKTGKKSQERKTSGKRRSESERGPEIARESSCSTSGEGRRTSKSVTEIKLEHPLNLQNKKQYGQTSTGNNSLTFYNRELSNIKGWYPGITEENYDEIIQRHQDKIGHYFIWYCEAKDAVLVTIISSSEPVNVRVKKNGQYYCFKKSELFDTIKDLIEHTIRNGIIKL